MSRHSDSHSALRVNVKKARGSLLRRKFNAALVELDDSILEIRLAIRDVREGSKRNYHHR
jgi:hypothetical protein